MSTQKITMLIGLPGSGKSTRVNTEKRGTVVLSRDKEGGLISDLLPKMEKAVSDGAVHIILDCTFLTAASRAPFIILARQLQVPIEAVFLKADPATVQYNLCWRMCQRYGKVLRTKEDYEKVKDDPNMFPPAAFFSMQKKFEAPNKSEGFAHIEEVAGTRAPLPPEFCNGAVIVDYDGTVRDTKSGDKYPLHPKDVLAFPQAAKKLQKLAAEGVLLLGASNQSGVAKGKPSMETCHDCFKETNRQLGVEIAYDFDFSPAGPTSSWHRKPMCGMAVDAIWRHKLDPRKVIFVGDMTSDRTFAERVGFKFEYAKDFFGLPEPSKSKGIT